jgi:DNA-binding transcriptional LysR family regulator
MKNTDFDPEALRALVAIVDTGGFTAAAGVLHKTQAAVSATIAGLERLAGCRLLERSRRGTWPTPSGEVLLGYARRILHLLDAAAQAVESGRLAGTARLGLPDECLAGLVAPVVGAFAREHPEVVVDIRCDLSVRLEAALWAGELDAAITVREPGKAAGEMLWRESLVWCIPPDHAPQVLRPLPVALFAEGCRTRPLVIGALTSAGIPFREACRASHIAGLVAAAGQGLAVVALARRAVPPGWRVLGPQDDSGEGHDLPPLPVYEAALLLPQRASGPACRLAAVLRTVGGTDVAGQRDAPL